MGISAISTATGSTLIPSNDATASTTVATPQSKSAPSETVSISDAAINAFEKSLRQVNNQINSYEHQVTWRLDHHSPVTGPNGINESNGTVVTSATGGAQLVHTGATSSLANQLSFQVAGALGSTQLSFATGTRLSAVVEAVM